MKGRGMWVVSVNIVFKYVDTNNIECALLCHEIIKTRYMKDAHNIGFFLINANKQFAIVQYL